MQNNQFKKLSTKAKLQNYGGGITFTFILGIVNIITLIAAVIPVFSSFLFQNYLLKLS